MEVASRTIFATQLTSPSVSVSLGLTYAVQLSLHCCIESVTYLLISVITAPRAFYNMH